MSLLTRIAKDRDAGISGDDLFTDLYARLAAALQILAAPVLTLRGHVEATDMWIERYGFRRLNDDKHRLLLWIPVDP